MLFLCDTNSTRIALSIIKQHIHFKSVTIILLLFSNRIDNETSIINLHIRPSIPHYDKLSDGLDAFICKLFK